MIHTIRVTSGQEKILAEILMRKSKAEKLDVPIVNAVGFERLLETGET